VHQWWSRMGSSETLSILLFCGHMISSYSVCSEYTDRRSNSSNLLSRGSAYVQEEEESVNINSTIWCCYYIYSYTLDECTGVEFCSFLHVWTPRGGPTLRDMLFLCNAFQAGSDYAHQRRMHECNGNLARCTTITLVPIRLKNTCMYTCFCTR